VAWVTAEVSIYPLRQATLSPAIDAALDVFHSHKLEVHPGAMSTMISGEEEEVFTSLRETFRKAAAYGGMVMEVRVSNACG
jgi:uncharacterized protein YqgV (UPF0045/DUF77 family)